MELGAGVADDLVAYARKKVGHALTHTGSSVLHARVRVTRHGDPARDRPVLAQANVNVNGRPVRVQVEATTPREAVDLLVDRLDHRLEQLARGWQARRGRVFEGEHHEWRHDFPATPRRSYYPRPPAERRVVRHKTISPLPCSVDEAVAEMDDLDHDSHVFVEPAAGSTASSTAPDPAGYGWPRSTAAPTRSSRTRYR